MVPFDPYCRSKLVPKHASQHADWSDWIVRLQGEQAGRLLAALYTGDLFEESTIHASFLWAHHAAQPSLVPLLALCACIASRDRGP